MDFVRLMLNMLETPGAPFTPFTNMDLLSYPHG